MLLSIGVLIISFFVLIYCLSNIFKLVLRIYTNKKHDKNLNINTQGLIKYKDNKLYNRTESTPYKALETLIAKYSITNEDSLVDFGAGKGRAIMFLHKETGVTAIGVEANETTYRELEKNVNRYLKSKKVNRYLKSKKANGTLGIEKEYAENYKITDENKFFFFNPFKVSIFEKVVKNIINNAESQDKKVDIILYYPTKKYQDFLKTTPFKITDEIKIKNAIGFTEKIIIYSYSPGETSDF